jgi:hypothetical protein
MYLEVGILRELAAMVTHNIVAGKYDELFTMKYPEEMRDVIRADMEEVVCAHLERLQVRG